MPKTGHYRSYLALYLAALLPIVLFAIGITLAIGFRERNALEATALSKVREIAGGIDRYVAAQLKAAEVMAAVGALRRDDLQAFYDLAARLKDENPGWSTVVLSNASGQQLINLSRPFESQLAGVSDKDSFAEVLAVRTPVIGNLAERGLVTGDIFIPIRVPVLDGDQVRYVITIALNPRELSKMFELSDAPPDWVGAVVDHNGRLLARSVLASELVGRKATSAALDAIKKGTQGLYDGRTLEGLDTVFAFYTSPLTGWSVHYAVPRSTYNAPLRSLLWIVGLCAAAAVISAFILFSILSREAARQRAEQVTREKDSQFRVLAEAMPNHVWTSLPDGSLDWFNEQTYNFSRAKPGELDGQGWAKLVHPEDLPAAAKHWAAALATGNPYETEFRLRRHDGVFRWHVARAVPILGTSGGIIRWVGTNTDIEEQKNTAEALAQLNDNLEHLVEERSIELVRTQEELRQSQKMEALGNLTGGIAHDFNNLLQLISGNLELVARDVAGNGNTERRIRNAMTGVSRGAKLASQLLSFGRRQPLEPKVVNLGRLIGGIDDLLRRALGEEIEIETVIAGGLWNAFVDPNNMENALINLAINARDAMGGKGKLTIEANNAFLDAEYSKNNSEATPGQYVLVAVSDTGSGISRENVERVFEPFFTTKPEGKGSGLGLSMVYGFVKQSHGHIKIYSEVGHGTTIKLYLPRSLLTAEAPLQPEIVSPSRGNESILVVEDDDEVRDTAVATLRDLGYHVLEANNAKSALTVIENGAQIDLLFTDVVMPGKLRSPELARLAKTRLPRLAVLFTSGYTENAIVHGGKLDEGVELLSKPYSREALATRIRGVLKKRV